MLTVRELDALDLVLWQRSGERAAAWLGCSQSTVSRQIQHVLRLLKLRLLRREGEWQLQGQLDGHTEILLLERHLHQQYRLLMGGRLRLEATYWAAAAFLDPMPAGWAGGVWDHVGMERPLQLLRDRVIDAWLASYQADLPNDDPQWVVFDLCSLPVRLMADPGHPLSGERRLRLADLHHFPSLALPEGMFPRSEAILRRQGLWNCPVAMQRYQASCWEGRTADRVTLSFGNALSHRLSPQLVPLDWDLGLSSGEVLVVRRDLAQHARIQDLVETLRRRAQLLGRQLELLQAVG